MAGCREGWKGRVGMVEMENVDGGKQGWHDVGKVGREELGWRRWRM